MDKEQPKTVFGDPITAVHVIYPGMFWQVVAQWSDTYKAYVIVKDEDRFPWTSEGARTWSPFPEQKDAMA